MLLGFRILFCMEGFKTLSDHVPILGILVAKLLQLQSRFSRENLQAMPVS